LLEAGLAQALGWSLSWRSPLAWLVRDLLIPVVWINAHIASGSEWRGNRIATAGVAVLRPDPA
jgi:ceramide glucosyltransferase